MAKNINTIIKLFLLFLTFQVSLNFIIEVIPDNVPTFSDENQQYLDFITTKVNGQFDADSQGNSLLTNFKNSMSTENLFNSGVAEAFWGVLVVIGTMIVFVIQLAVNILFTPQVVIEILLYDFVASSSLLFGMALVVNVFFYMTLFYIIFKRRTQQ